jgi:hypothetical protein
MEHLTIGALKLRFELASGLSASRACVRRECWTILAEFEKVGRYEGDDFHDCLFGLRYPHGGGEQRHVRRRN